MRSRYLLYRAALHLYPRAYRRQYSGQMLQTVTDMLDDQPDKRGKAMVWLRVGCELPLSILRENITNVGDNVMHKFASITNKRLVGSLVAILLVILIFTLPGWVRRTAIPKTVSIFYGHQVNETLLNQQKNIGEPFTQLDSNVPDSVNNCGTVATSRLKTRVECQSSLQAYVKLPQDEAGKQQVVAAAKAVDAALKKEGYTAGSNGVTFTSLVTGTYEGKDYSPDAYYQKQIGLYSCVFDTTVGYSNPAPAAINMVLWCTRSVFVFGTPGEQTYRPGQGL